MTFVRSSLAIRIFVVIIGLYMILTMLHTHVMLQYQNAAFRSLNIAVPSPPFYGNRTAGETSDTNNYLPQANASHHVARITVDVIPELRLKSTILSRTVVTNRIDGDLHADRGHDTAMNLDSENFILVKPEKKRPSRERKNQGQYGEILDVQSWIQIQEDRRNHLREVCKRRPELHVDLTRIINAKSNDLWPFLVNDRFNIIFALVPSAASTFWKDVFQQIPMKISTQTRSRRTTDSVNLRNLSSFEPWEIRHRLHTYKKMILVRNPFARLVSAYRRTFNSPSTKQKRVDDAELHKSYRANQIHGRFNMNVSITFREFTYFIHEVSNIDLSYHWRPLSRLALPCDIEYDYIGRLEGGQKEFDYMLRSARIQWLAKYKPSSLKTPSHMTEIYYYYLSQLLPHQLRKLYTLYEPDFDLFGYGKPNNIRV